MPTDVQQEEFLLDKQQNITVLENGDRLLLTLRQPVPLAGSAPRPSSYGWVYIQEEECTSHMLSDTPYGWAQKQLESQLKELEADHRKLIDSLDKADDRLVELLDVGGLIQPQDATRQRVEHARVQVANVLGTVHEQLEQLQEKLECFQDELGLPLILTVGIVSPAKAGIETCEKLLQEYGLTGEKRWSPAWCNAAIHALIGHGLSAVSHEQVVLYADREAGRRDAWERANMLLTTAGFDLDRERNALGNDGWDFLSGRIGPGKGRR